MGGGKGGRGGGKKGRRRKEESSFGSGLAIFQIIAKNKKARQWAAGMCRFRDTRKKRAL
jgi:hypothetical protein